MVDFLDLIKMVRFPSWSNGTNDTMTPENISRDMTVSPRLRSLLYLSMDVRRVPRNLLLHIQFGKLTCDVTALFTSATLSDGSRLVLQE